MITVVLVDDQQLVRAGFRAILADEDDITVVGEADAGETGLRLVRELRPDVVLMDVQMPQLDGLEVTRRIVTDPALSGVRVVVLTTFDVDDYVYAALRAGASGFLLKDTEPLEMIHAVRVAARGDALLAPAVTRRLIADFARTGTRPKPNPRLASLTAREREVLSVVAAGLSNDDIASRLFLSPATVKTHVARIMSKLAVHDRSQLVIIAYESALVTPGWLTNP